MCHIQHERPVAFHEFIPVSNSSDIENIDEVHEPPVMEEEGDLDSMPELEDEINLGNVEIPLWLIPHGMLITFRWGQVTFEREQGPPWQEVLAQMLEEQGQVTENN